MNWLLDFGSALTHAWTATYTHGLAHDARAERREEIDCDLWHQRHLAELDRQPVTGTALEVLARLLLGVPSDIAWRIETGSHSERSTSVNNTMAMKIGFLVAALPLLFVAANGVGMLAGGGDFPNWTERLLYGFAVTGASAVALAGLWLCASKPAPGLAMVGAGSAVVAGLFYWMLPITIPIALVIIAFAVKRSGITVWPFRQHGPTATA